MQSAASRPPPATSTPAGAQAVTIPDDLDKLSHGAIARDLAVTRLASSQPGTFIVRSSQSASNTYSLSVVVVQGGRNEIHHVRIVSSAKGYAVNEADLHFPTIPQLMRSLVERGASRRQKGDATSVMFLQPLLP